MDERIDSRTEESWKHASQNQFVILVFIQLVTVNCLPVLITLSVVSMLHLIISDHMLNTYSAAYSIESCRKLLSAITYLCCRSAMKFTQHQIQELNICWNTVYRVSFGFNRWESVKCFIHGLGRLNFVHIIKLCRIRFFFHLLQACSRIIVYYNLFYVYFADVF